MRKTLLLYLLTVLSAASSSSSTSLAQEEEESQVVDYTSFTVDELHKLSDSELEGICLKYGFELVPPQDEDGQILEVTHADYVEAAQQCLELGAEMEELLQKNPEILKELKAEAESMQREKERLEAEILKLTEKLQKSQENLIPASSNEEEVGRAFVKQVNDDITLQQGHSYDDDDDDDDDDASSVADKVNDEFNKSSSIDDNDSKENEEGVEQQPIDDETDQLQMDDDPSTASNEISPQQTTTTAETQTPHDKVTQKEKEVRQQQQQEKETDDGTSDTLDSGIISVDEFKSAVLKDLQKIRHIIKSAVGIDIFAAFDRLKESFEDAYEFFRRYVIAVIVGFKKQNYASEQSNEAPDAIVSDNE